MSKKLQPIMAKLTSDSVPASTKFLPASMSLLMVNSVIGASSTSVSTVLPPTVVVPSITSSASRPNTAWTSTPLRSLRSA
jgi:hypothetical protein